MRPHERTFDLKVVDTIQSSLRPDALFDLLADPQGCATWHEHPGNLTVDAVDAAPGLALQGAEYHTRGTFSGIPYTSTTVVREAQRPRTYASETEMIVHHPRALLATQFCTERYTIDASPSGSTVRYESVLVRRWNDGALAVASRLLQKVFDSLFAVPMTRRNLRMLLSSAERRGESARV
jgi:hypothetical protein